MSVYLNLISDNHCRVNAEDLSRYQIVIPPRLQYAPVSVPVAQPIVPLSAPRVGVFQGLSNCVREIWEKILACLIRLKNSLNRPPSPLAQRELRLIQDESKIPRMLANELEYARRQMQQEVPKGFIYHDAPSDWVGHEEQVSSYTLGIAHAQGRRWRMEDEHLAASYELKIAGRSFPMQLFGIFDGHGGSAAARFARDHLSTALMQALVEFNPNGLTDAGIWKALKIATVRVNNDFKNRYGQVANDEGTTATFALILDNKLWTANVGDSRTVLDNAGAPVQLSEDAKPDDPRYRKGIEKRGGTVVEAGGCPRVNGDLAVARSLGDYRLGGAISARSKITVKSLSEILPGSHLILCCDGVYEVARTVDIVETVHTHQMLPLGMLARNILYSAYASGSTDNLSAMIIKVS